MKQRFLIGLILLFSLSTYNSVKQTEINSNFDIQEIIIENNNIIKDLKIKKNLSFLYNRNIFLLDLKDIEKELKKIQFIDRAEVKKVYPNKLKLKIFEKKPIVILQNKKKKFFITDKFDLIDYEDFDKFKNLPVVFGEKEKFTIFYSELKKIDFPTQIIESFYQFEAERWDIITKKKQLIKLPIKNYIKSLENYLNLKDESNFSNYKVFDYRIDGQLILK